MWLMLSHEAHRLKVETTHNHIIWMQKGFKKTRKRPIQKEEEEEEKHWASLEGQEKEVMIGDDPRLHF